MAQPERRIAPQPLDLERGLVRPVVGSRNSDAMHSRRLALCLDDARYVEACGNGLASVHVPERKAADVLGPAHLLVRERPARDDARDEASLRLDEADDLRPDTNLGGGSSGGMLGRAVDAEEPRVLARDAQNGHVLPDATL